MFDSSHYTRLEKLLLEAARMFNSTLEYDQLIEHVLRLVMTAVDCEAALVFRIDHQRSDMKVRALRTNDDAMQVFRLIPEADVAGWLEPFRESRIITDPARECRSADQVEQAIDLKIRCMVNVPLIGKGHMIGVVQAINKEDGPFTDADLDILAGLNNQMAVAIDNARLYRDLRREATQKQALYEVGITLSRPLELPEVLQKIMELLRKVVAYDVGGVFLVDPENNQVDSIYAVGYGAEHEKDLHLKFGQGLVGAVATSGETIIVPDVTTDPRYVQTHPETRSEIVAPISVDDRLVGVFNLESFRRNTYGRNEKEMITAFASQAAISLERARLAQRMLAAKALEEQLNIARQIQQSFLPDVDPDIPGYDVAGTNISSGQVGGDYYDFIRIVPGQTGIAIADVSGKGVPAALIMASYRASLIAEIRNNYSIRTICEKTNRLMCESLEPGNFVTCVYGVLDSNAHIFTYANCGHNLPILLRQSGDVEFLRDGGPVLGITPDGHYDERAILIHPGDILLFYTDGVTEIFDAKGVEFGTNRLVDVLKKHRDKPARDIEKAIYKAARGFAASDHVFDDLTMVVARRLPG